MKLWKGATFAFMLCGAALSILLIRNMAAVGQLRSKMKHPHASSSSSRPSSESMSKTSPPSSSSSSSSSAAESTALSWQMGGLRRRTRSADEMNSLLSEFSMMFQSFTEGELQHVVGTLLDRKRQKSRRLGEQQARRTKRARRPKPCSLRELELTVSELGLGYDSDGFRRKKGRKDKVSNGPCCRPTAFEKDFSFLDNKSRYHTVQNVSAKNC
ncbi:hypothetical protein L3Q82_021289, partial [Scortum barcoo]